MEFRVLALGDVTSEDGTRHLARTLRPFQKVHGVDFTVVNGENVSGVGLTAMEKIAAGEPADAAALTPNYLRQAQAERTRQHDKDFYLKK